MLANILLKYRPSIATVLLGGIGGLISIAMGILLFLAYGVSATNTLDLLATRINDRMSVLEDRITSHLKTAEDHVRAVAHAIVQEQMTFNPKGIETLRLTMRAVPNISGMAIFLENGTSWRLAPDGYTAKGTFEDIGLNREFYDLIMKIEQPRWVEPLWSHELLDTILIAQYPIKEDERNIGAGATVITVAEMSDFLARLVRDKGTSFLIAEDGSLIAHSSMPDIAQSEQTVGRQELLTAEDLGDEALANYLQGKFKRHHSMSGLQNMDGGIVELPSGEFWVVVTKPLTTIDGQKWRYGTTIPTEQAVELFDRIQHMLMVGGIVIVVTLLLLWKIARSIRQPVVALADASDHIRTLDLGSIKALPKAGIRELDEASDAFKKMTGALQWFETYVPRRLVSALVRDGFEGGVPTEQRAITVLFTDIVGFTSLSESMSANEITAFLNAHFSLLARCIEAEDGTIDKYIGDSVMAFWGAPEDQPDQAERACRAVMAIAAALHLDNEARKARGLAPIRVRIGLHTGPAVAGNIGAPGRINYTLVGDTVNASNRLEALGKEIDGDAETIVLASEETIRAAHLTTQPTDVGSHRLRGRSEPVKVYRVV